MHRLYLPCPFLYGADRCVAADALVREEPDEEEVDEEEDDKHDDEEEYEDDESDGYSE